MIDQGIYTLTEVAKYTSVRPTTLRAWFLPRSDGKGLGPVFKSDYVRMGNDFAVSFLNLIEAYVASFFKANHVKPSDIRRTHEILKAELKVDHPFAHVDLSAGLGRIIYEKSKSPSDERFVDVISKQLWFPQFKDGLHKISYNAKTKLADTWEIREGIFVNPRAGFGKPVVQNTGVSTLIVARQYKANRKDAALVARLFKIPQDSVETAFRFEVDLGRIAA